MAKCLTLLNGNEIVEHFNRIHYILDSRERSFCDKQFRQVFRKSVNGEFKRQFSYSEDSHKYKSPVLFIVGKASISASSNIMIYTIETDINTGMMVAFYYLKSLTYNSYEDSEEAMSVIMNVNVHFLKRFYQRYLGIEEYPSFEEMVDGFADYINKTAVMGGSSSKLFYKNKVKNTKTNFLETSDGDYMIFDRNDHVITMKTFISHDMLTKGQFALYEKDILFSFSDVLTQLENKRNSRGCMAAYSLHRQSIAMTQILYNEK